MTREDKLARYKRMLNAGDIDQSEYETLVAPFAASSATVEGAGAVAQGGGDALGERSAKVDGDNCGTIVTGTQIVNHYHATANARLSKEEIAQRVVGYLRWLRERTQSIELRGIERAGGAPVGLLPLEKAYVPLRAKSMPRVGDSQAAMGSMATVPMTLNRVSAKPMSR
jgi:hypothetical protein